MIYSALYYPGSLAAGDLIVRDNRYYPGKYLETLPVWMQYVRKHYPDEPLTLFADAASPIPWMRAAELLGESFTWSEYIEGQWCMGGVGLKANVHIKVLTQFAGQYFRPMQRNLVEALCTAYERNEDCFWLDNDAFLNTDIRPLVAGYDWASSSIEHHQMTTGSVCFHVSTARLHALDSLLPTPLPTYLRSMLNNGPTDTRMHSLQEGGLYKMFCYGRVRDMSKEINMSHLSCYKNFMTFLRANPLDEGGSSKMTPYVHLVRELESFDFTRIPGVQLDFHDAYHVATQ